MANNQFIGVIDKINGAGASLDNELKSSSLFDE